ncbi:MAG: hypothetical protein CL913_11135 [Deltaproteobacteria bacterium]|uniref:DUF1499 domain-containing protein n=1 Tax=SAR324 cluster bacterium TaxID=2024889 RepID=A0A2D6YIM2_9DELT|nr:hypothetical protein [Deltaproteobacteria bacterium]MAH63004.1 hypothetical protein [SAR324 cluster bacterium]|tara:strand:- start:287 stop:733 length:447 start_codon:yes stop_codon:yes gene_type:complete
MWFLGQIMYASFSLLLGFSIIGCTGNRPVDLGLKDGYLRPCPSSPNCVNSMVNEDEVHRIEPFRGVSLAELRELLQNEESVEIVTDHENYLHAEFTSLIMRFVDDVEFFSIAEEQVIHVRSASRLGSSDLGANRRRVEGLRTKLLGGK